uniref:DNA or RNA helicases of superfamily II n=1 Tax=Desulfovibrio sp. U5L TaxID=596152 RepID=I2Q6G9_9BACT
MTNDKAFGNVIYSYTRAQAIADGVLIDVTAEAKAHGFKVPVAITDHLFNVYVDAPTGLEAEGQSTAGRLHDLLTLAMLAARTSKGTDRAYFKISFLMTPGKIETVEVIAHIGPGDHGEPVLTIMLPEDD